jgi:hypothetical protein
MVLFQTKSLVLGLVFGFLALRHTNNPTSRGQKAIRSTQVFLLEIAFWSFLAVRAECYMDARFAAVEACCRSCPQETSEWQSHKCYDIAFKHCFTKSRQLELMKVFEWTITLEHKDTALQYVNRPATTTNCWCSECPRVRAVSKCAMRSVLLARKAGNLCDIHNYVHSHCFGELSTLRKQDRW